MTDAQLTYKVELDVSGSAFGSAFTATDVTSKAVAGVPFEPITITWGRQDQHSDVTPATVGGALLNTDGTFTPGNTSGTYYPNIRRNLRRRVSVGVNSTTLRLSEDYAASIEVQPSRDAPAVTSITGSDILARFGQSPATQDVAAASIGCTLRGFLAEEMMLDSPACLYMLQEAEGATSFGDVTGNCSPLVVTSSKYGAGTVTAGQAPPSTFLAGTVVTVDNPSYGSAAEPAQGSWLAGALPDLSSSTSWSVEMWVQMPTTAPAVGTEGTLAAAGSGDLFLMVQANGTLSFQHTAAGGSNIFTTSTWLDGEVHQVVAVVSGTTVTLYVDGVSQASAACSSHVGPAMQNWTFGMGGTRSFSDEPFSGGFAFIATYPTALSATRVAQHYQAGATAFAGERVDQRITRLLSYRPNTGSSLDTSPALIGPQDITGRSLQDCLFEAAQVDGGTLSARSGTVTFRSRTNLFNPTPSVTLDMKAGGVDFGSNWREDTQDVVNDITITNSTTGSEQRFYDAASITADGEYSTSLSLPLNSDTDALNMGGWIVSNGVRQQLAATPLVINLLHITAAQAQAVLSLAPLDCIRLTNCPVPASTATMTFIVQGGTISLAAEAATATLNVTRMPEPVGVWDTSTWDASGVTWAF